MQADNNSNNQPELEPELEPELLGDKVYQGVQADNNGNNQPELELLFAALETKSTKGQSLPRYAD
eukprot:3435270-Ditylum_brightwellii.AAC.1